MNPFKPRVGSFGASYVYGWCLACESGRALVTMGPVSDLTVTLEATCHGATERKQFNFLELEYFQVSGPVGNWMANLFQNDNDVEVKLVRTYNQEGFK